MKTKKCRLNFLTAIMILAIVFCSASVCAVPASAASSSKTTAKLTTLKAGKTYKKYDVTGDGKADRIKLSKQKKDTSIPQQTLYTVKVTVNKKIKFEVTSAEEGVDIRCFHKGKKGVLISDDLYATAGNVINWYKISDGTVSTERISGDAYNATMKKSGSKLVLKLYPRFGKATKKTYRLKGCKLVG